MPRRRDLQGAVTVELVPGEPTDPTERDLDPTTPEPPDGPPGGRHGAVRRRRRRGLVVAGVVAALVVAGVVVVDRAADARATAERIQHPGGLRPLGRSVEERWSVPLDARTTSVEATSTAVVAQTGDALVAYDVATGQERWRATVGPDAVCSTSDPLGRTRDAETVACVVDGGTTLVVHDDAGTETVRRTLDPPLPADAPGQTFTLTPDVLVRAERVGEPVDLAGVTVDPTSFRTSVPVQARDLVVRAEDVATGAERWERTLAAEPSDACLAPPGAGSSALDELVLNPEGISLWLVAGATTIFGCGVEAMVGPQGDDLSTSAWSALEPFEGGYVRSTDDGSEVLDPDGTVVREVQGRLQVPSATDGADPGWVVAHGARTSLQTPDGDVLWATDQRIERLALATDDVLVVVEGNGRLRALDPWTGEPGWRSDVTSLGGSNALGALTVATDGRSLVTVGATSLGPSGAVTLAAYDLADGSRLWQATDPSWTGAVRVVDGRLVVVGEDAIRVLG